MATYRQMIYMILDELKVLSDDSYYTEDHIMFLLNKYRAYLLKQKYSDTSKETSISNMQTICVDLERYPDIDTDLCLGYSFLRSTEKIPSIIDSGTLDRFVRISSKYQFAGEFAYISPERFKYVGYNRWTKNLIYCTIGPDNYLYFKSNNPQVFYLKKIQFNAIFENPEEAVSMQCPDENGEVECDITNTNFPLEEALIPQCINLIIKDLLGATWRPKDDINNAKDDLSDMQQFINRNMRNNFKRELYGNPNPNANL